MDAHLALYIRTRDNIVDNSVSQLCEPGETAVDRLE